MPKSPPRPKPFAVGRVRVRVHSGPRAEDGRWRWRADRPAGTRDGRDVREAVWSGWGTRDEAEAEVLLALTSRGERWQGPEDIRTVYDLLDVWVADVSPHDRSEYTTRARRGCAQRLVLVLGDVAIARLGRPTLDGYVRGYRGASSTLRQDLRALGAAWAWARERELVPDRTLPSVRLRSTGRVYSDRTPRPSEILDVLRVLRERAEWAWRACYLLYATGCRPGEVASLTWDRVDLERRTAAVTGKTGRRVVHLHREVAAELAGWTRGPQLGPGGRPTTTASPDTVCGCRPATVRSRLHDHLAAACEQLGQERWSPYGLRRAAVVRLYRSGVDPSVAAEAIGHSAAVALRTYRQVEPEEIAEAIERAGLGVVPARDNVLPLRRGEESG